MQNLFKSVNVLAKIKQNKGGTIDFNLNSPTSGFVVGTSTDAVQVRADTPNIDVEFAAIVNGIWSTQGRNVHVGFWLNQGIWYIEPVAVCLNLEDALSIGTTNSQQCIWDITNNIEINV